MTAAVQVQVGPRTLRLSNLDKVLYPQANFTKGQVVDYYRRIAPVILPHLKDRPLTLKRYPNGTHQPFFYEKRCPSHKPPWVPTAHVYSHRSNDDINYCLVNDEATLIWVANLASIEMHVLLSKASDVQRPTMMVFDLDPGEPATIVDCIAVALEMRESLEKLGLKSFVKTSGGKGLHLCVPLNTPTTFDHTKPFAQALGQLLEKQDPTRVVTNMRKDLRAGKVFVDWSQNDEHKTTACAYTLRARSRPTVSTPLKWDELERFKRRRSADALQCEPIDILRRLDKFGDLFEPMQTLKQKLPKL